MYNYSTQCMWVRLCLSVLSLLHHPRGSEMGNTDQVAAGLVQASEEKAVNNSTGMLFLIPH